MVTALLLMASVNAATLLRFGWDKWRAVRNGRRIAEAHLLVLALIGGSPAAFLARRLFRHKTRKQPFSRRLKAIALLHVAVLCGLSASLIRLPG